MDSPSVIWTVDFYYFRSSLDIFLVKFILQILRF
jgi:hypothetical protein